MIVVEVPTKKSTLVKTLADMREWLDRHRCEIRQFREVVIRGDLFLQVGFAEPELASEFAEQFAGDKSNAVGARELAVV